MGEVAVTEEALLTEAGETLLQEDGDSLLSSRDTTVTLNDAFTTITAQPSTLIELRDNGLEALIVEINTDALGVITQSRAYDFDAFFDIKRTVSVDSDGEFVINRTVSVDSDADFNILSIPVLNFDAAFEVTAEKIEIGDARLFSTKDVSHDYDALLASVQQVIYDFDTDLSAVRSVLIDTDSRLVVLSIKTQDTDSRYVITSLKEVSSDMKGVVVLLKPLTSNTGDAQFTVTIDKDVNSDADLKSIQSVDIFTDALVDIVLDRLHNFDAFFDLLLTQEYQTDGKLTAPLSRPREGIFRFGDINRQKFAGDGSVIRLQDGIDLGRNMTANSIVLQDNFSSAAEELEPAWATESELNVHVAPHGKYMAADAVIRSPREIVVPIATDAIIKAGQRRFNSIDASIAITRLVEEASQALFRVGVFVPEELRQRDLVMSIVGQILDLSTVDQQLAITAIAHELELSTTETAAFAKIIEHGLELRKGD